jgi:hypothetical protein
MLAAGVITAAEGGHGHHDHGHGHGEKTKSDKSAGTCVVSGEALGSMGDPITVEHGEHKIKLCCDGCTEDFDADPEKYIALAKKAKEAGAAKDADKAKPVAGHGGHDHGGHGHH